MVIAKGSTLVFDNTKKEDLRRGLIRGRRDRELFLKL